MGANFGNNTEIIEAAKELGAYIGKNGHRLIYGGSKCGLMGVIAQSTLDHNGDVIGVEPECFMKAELQHPDVKNLIVTKDFPERRTKMMELGDAFIAFPGGTGTLDEISEIMAQSSLDNIQAPCILYNLYGFYDCIQVFLNNTIEAGFSTKERQKNIFFCKTLDEIDACLKNYLK